MGVVLGSAGRQVRRMLASPPLLVPVLLFSPVLLAAFAGGLSALGNSPGFDYPDYTTFIYVYVLMQGAASSGAITGVAVAQDFESGFARRMFLSTRNRWPLVAGYALSSLFRFVLIVVASTACGLVLGMDVAGNPLEFAGVLALAALINVAATLFAIGMALRMRSVQAGPAMQLPILLATFLAPVYAPRELMTGWVGAVADVNPVSALYEAGRALLAGDPERVLPAFSICGGLIVLFSIYAGLGVRKATQGGARAG